MSGDGNTGRRRSGSRGGARAVRNALLSPVQCLLLALALSVIPALPRRREVALGRWLGRRLASMKRFRSVALANLDIAYGDRKTAEEKLSLHLASMEHLGMVVLDYFWFSRRTRERIAKYCTAGDAAVERWISGNFGGSFISAHLGNWDLGGVFIASSGRVLWSVYKPFGSGMATRMLARFRGRQGQRAIQRRGAIAGVMRAIRANDLTALLLDQHIPPADGGVYVPFFGVPATFSGAVGVLSHRLGSPILVAAMIHDAEKDVYALRSFLEIPGGETKARDPVSLTREIAGAIRRMIEAHPEQWLWSYRRWKRIPRGADASLYPFYAKPDENGVYTEAAE